MVGRNVLKLNLSKRLYVNLDYIYNVLQFAKIRTKTEY